MSIVRMRLLKSEVNFIGFISAAAARAAVFGAALVCLGLPLTAWCGDKHYTEPQVYPNRPSPAREYELGQIGVTGIKARIHKGVLVTVEGTEPGTPAEGKFEKGEIIVGVNGVLLKGKNPLVILGTALTEAEAKDGVLAFDVQPLQGAVKKVTITIPVMGAYSKTYPLNCKKSQKIIAQAAEYYSGKDRMKRQTLVSGLTCLFLLSTGDDKYVPRVKEYFAQFLNADGTAKKIGGSSWHDGYNGVAVAEYYLRTGDQSVLPILQSHVDNARDGQRYGVGWGHHGGWANPAYESGGGMQHSGGTQILLTLVLGKMCGVEVDDATLASALRHWYSFAGHGAIPVADQRYWAAFGSATRDGATAAIMQVASQASGDVTIYRKAKEYMAMSAINTWPDSTFFSLIWHNLGGAFMLEYNPELYHQTLHRFSWMYDLGRQASGAFWIDPVRKVYGASEWAVVLGFAYTAPLKTLAITGAPRSTYAKDFTLPEHLWGNKADLAFLSSKHHKDFSKYGKEDEIYVPRYQLPTDIRYSPDRYKDLPLDMLLKNVRHAHCVVRMGAAKVLQFNGHYDELEKLLRDPDPRLRRAALDGINDCRPWFAGCPVYKYSLPAEKYTPAMCDAITKILSNPDEAWFVIDGALMALYHAPISLIEKNIPNILPWITHESCWWLRGSAFLALMGLEKDEELFIKHLPAALNAMINEERYSPRHQMLEQLKGVLERSASDSRVHRVVADGLARVTKETIIFPDERNYNRSRSGVVNVMESALAAIAYAPEQTAATVAEAFAAGDLLTSLDTGKVMKLVKTHDKSVKRFHIGLLPALELLSEKDRARVTDVLFNTFRPELIKRMGSGKNVSMMNLIIDLNKLKKPITGWEPVGTPEHTKRVWRFRSFDPPAETVKTPQEGRSALPTGMDNWFMPEFDDSAWKSGMAPIGKGKYTAGRRNHQHVSDSRFYHKNKSDWGDGKFLAARTTFTLTEDDLKKDIYSIRILSPTSLSIYLNGHYINSGRSGLLPQYITVILGPEQTRHLKKGVNTLAVHASSCRWPYGPYWQKEPIGQMDVYFESLKESDLLLE